MKLLSALFLVLFGFSANAKAPSEVRSAFLYQMAKFIEFPSTDTSRQVSFCFYDLQQGPGQLLSNNNTLTLNNLPIEVKLITTKQSISELSRVCDITYIDERLEGDIIPIWTDTISLNTLTIGESISFLEKGGIASLVQEGNKIRLYINKKQLLQRSFKVQSRLLAVSKFHPN